MTHLCSGNYFLIFLSLLLPTSYLRTQYLYNVALSSNESSQLKFSEGQTKILPIVEFVDMYQKLLRTIVSPL